jgi:hypothetical protein
LCRQRDSFPSDAPPWSFAKRIGISRQRARSVGHHTKPSNLQQHPTEPELKSAYTLIASAALALLAGGNVQAQVDPLTTTAGFKAACEAPGNRVRITTDMAVNSGLSAGYPERVRTGCTIELVGDSEIQFDKVGLAFAGPLVITGGSKTGVSMQYASLAGTSVAIRLSGTEGYLRSEFSRIDATAGNLDVTLGSTSNVEMVNYITGGVPLTRATLAATGNLSVTGGAKMVTSLKEVGLVAGRNLSLRSTGSESELKIDDTGVLSFGGNISILMQGSKSKLEGSNSALTAQAGDVDIATSQTESGIGLSNVTTSSTGRTQVYGAGSLSNVGISNGSMTAGTGMFVSASAGSDLGNLKVEGTRVSAGTPMLFVTGSNGNTIVVGATLTSAGLLDIATGAGGKCEALGNRITAVTQQVCP